MHKTIFLMAMALIAAVLAGLVSNDIQRDHTLLADAGDRVVETAPERPVVADSNASEEKTPRAGADDVVLPQKRAAALLFMGVLRDN